MLRAVALGLIATTAPLDPALAAEPFDGKSLPLVWILPFAGILLSIAIMPLTMPHFWHRHFGKVAFFWALAFVVPFAVVFGPSTALAEVIHTALLEYIPFIILLLSLYTVAGGILVMGNLHGSPAVNTTILGIGTVIASWIGTTGASMVLIRPLLRANDDRRYNVHTVVFFIFLVSNIGGSLTPLGDPPLFLGFLKGVDFFWTTTHLIWETTVVAGILLVVFYFLDRYFYIKEEGHKHKKDPTPDSERMGLRGRRNLPLLLVIIGAILVSAYWKPGISFNIYGTVVELQSIVRDIVLVAAAGASLWITPKFCRQRNEFNWAPITEVAKLFAGIFVTIIPAIAILRAGSSGALAPLVDLVTNDAGQPVNFWYFWLTGILSSFLDNAPTYLVFFNLAGGDPQVLMGPLASTLAAISAGAVFMGANSYIGNAPNFMVLAIAKHGGVKMPSFFGFMGWAAVFLLPCFALVTLIFFV
ncbi:MAG: sodium:proton antiporter [Xanthobacteraceae bacterium]